MRSPRSEVPLPIPTALGIAYGLFGMACLIWGLVSGGLAAAAVGHALILIHLFLGAALLARRGALRASTVRFSVSTEEDGWRLEVGGVRVPGWLQLRFQYRWCFTRERVLEGDLALTPTEPLERAVDAARGLYRGPLGFLVLQDPLRWWRLGRALEGEVHLTCLPIPPRTNEDEPRTPSAGLFGPRSGRPQDLDDHFDTRPYYPGDDIRHLHWKLFAHTGQLILRKAEATPPPRERLFLLVDPWLPLTGEEAHRVLDRLAAAVWRWAELAHEHEADLAVIGPGLQWARGEPPTRLRRWLAALDPAPRVPIPDKDWPSGLAVFTHPANPRLAPYRGLLERLDARWVPPEEWA